MPLDGKIYSVTCRGKIFIFIFFFNILICIGRAAQPRLPLHLRGSVASTPGIRLTLRGSLGLHLASLDQFPLWPH